MLFTRLRKVKVENCVVKLTFFNLYPFRIILLTTIVEIDQLLAMTYPDLDQKCISRVVWFYDQSIGIHVEIISKLLERNLKTPFRFMNVYK